MRGSSNFHQGSFFYFFQPETMIPANHPLRAIKKHADSILKKLSSEFDKHYSKVGRPSVPPERLLKGTLLIALYTVRSDRLFCEMLSYNFLFRWFLDMRLDEKTLDPSNFTRLRTRLVETDLAKKFFDSVVTIAEQHGLLSDEHFTVDGTLIEAWASQKSFVPRKSQTEPAEDEQSSGGDGLEQGAGASQGADSTSKPAPETSQESSMPRLSQEEAGASQQEAQGCTEAGQTSDANESAPYPDLGPDSTDAGPRGPELVMANGVETGQTDAGDVRAPHSPDPGQSPVAADALPGGSTEAGESEPPSVESKLQQQGQAIFEKPRTPLGRDEMVDFRGQKRTNDTHQSTTDPEAKLMRKGPGKEAKLSFGGHALMENRNGFLIDIKVCSATDTEPSVAKDLIGRAKERGFNPKTIGADKGYHTKDFVKWLREEGIKPHIAQIAGRTTPGLDGRTTRHDSYKISQKVRKRVEEIFGWTKSVGGFRKTRLLGVVKNQFSGFIVGAAYNLVRLVRLLPE